MDRRTFVSGLTGLAVAGSLARPGAQTPPAAQSAVSVYLRGYGPTRFLDAAAEITAAERITLPRIIDKRIVEGAGHFVPHEKPDESRRRCSMRWPRRSRRGRGTKPPILLRSPRGSPNQ